MPIEKIAFDYGQVEKGKHLEHEILELLDEMDLDELPEKFTGGMAVPDGFVYSITVKSNEKEYKVLSDESALPGDMQPLVEILERLAKKQMRNRG